MSIKTIQKQLNEDLVAQTMECLAEFCVEESIRNVIEEIDGDSIKNVKLEEFSEDHGIGILNFRYNLIDDEEQENEEQDNYVTSKVYVVSALFGNNMIFVRCFHGDSLSCCKINGRKLCNFGVKEFINVVKKMIDEINETI